MPNRIPDLCFGPAGTNQGFTPAGVAAFDNLRPAAVVRELIQNSLDAARKSDVAPAIVRFELNRIPMSDVPGIGSYKRALDKAITTQRRMAGGVLAGQAELVVNKIQEALSREKIDVLTVLDNGIGLDERRMVALLSDGVSVKEGSATGTYGNGHATAIPASDLRYILYGGITEDGRRIGSGHAVLASHYEERKPYLCAGDGFYIRDFKPGHETLHTYAVGDDLPSLIEDALDSIEAKSTHGTSVIIPAFNNFLEGDKPLWKMVFQAVSANFFVAVENGELEVTVEDNRFKQRGRYHILKKSTLEKVLGENRDQRRSAAFLSGKRAFEAHRTYSTGVRHRIVTTAGEIEIHLIDNAAGVTRIDLCRNGMWIAADRKIPGFEYKFADQEPFCAVLSLNAQEGGVLHDDIRIAEGPLHDSINLKCLPPERRKRCRETLREIVDWIKENTKTVESDTYIPPDFLTIDFGDEDEEGGGRSRKGFWGAPVPINRRPTQAGSFSVKSDSDKNNELSSGEGSDSDSSLDGTRPRARPSLPTFFQAASCPTGENRRRIFIRCAQDCVDAELRLIVDEALDATCDRHGQDAYTPAVLSNVMLNGKPAGDDVLVRWDEGTVGVRLGDLVSGASVDIEVDYQLAGDFMDLPNPSLRVEIFKSARKIPSADSSPRG